MHILNNLNGEALNEVKLRNGRTCAAMHCDVLSSSRNKVLEVSLSKQPTETQKQLETAPAIQT